MAYGQFCSIARTLDLLGERWTLLVVRELLCGSTRFNSLLSAKPRILRVITQAESGATLELLMTDRGLHEAMLDYSINIVWLAAVVSIVTGFLLYFSLNRLLVRPMRKLSANMVAFSAAPESSHTSPMCRFGRA